MPDWLTDALSTATPIATSTMLTRLAVASALGIVIALTYRLSHGRFVRDSHTLFGTLVLLTILLAMVTMVIGDSVARAFGLVGALSIVRFRTVVEDTRDTAFVIFAVVVGMAVGTGLLLVALVGIPFVALAAIALAARGAPPPSETQHALTPESILTIRMGVGHPTTPVESLLASRSATWRLSGVATARQGAALDMTYSLRLAPSATAPTLALELNSIQGVQSVELRSADQID